MIKALLQALHPMHFSEFCQRQHSLSQGSLLMLAAPNSDGIASNLKQSQQSGDGSRQ